MHVPFINKQNGDMKYGRFLICLILAISSERCKFLASVLHVLHKNMERKRSFPETLFRQLFSQNHQVM